MKGHTLRAGASGCAIMAGLMAGFGWAAAAAAQTPQPQPAPASPGPAATPDQSQSVAEVVVTGSLIRGAATDSALPVQVIGGDELTRQGTPNTVDLIKNLSISNGVLGDTNQFDARAQGSEGSGSVNLRGLGPQRTLVLINGRRMSINPFGLGGAGVVDTNIIPVAAIGRVEILKDGAAATYGSDAIAGVVNFITRDRFDGLEVSGDYRYTPGSDGDYSFSALFGHKFDHGDVLLSASYQHRSELPVLERSFARKAYLDNPATYSAAGNPGSFLSFTAPSAAGAQLSRDAGCTPLGGTAGFSGTTPVCYEKYTDFDNLIETEEHYQIYGQVNFDLSENHHFHGEALYAKSEVPHWHTTPSYAILAAPTAEAYAGAPALLGGALPPTALYTGRFYVPPTNPGLIDYATKNPQFANFLTYGAAVLAPAARPIFLGGNPATRSSDNPLGASLGKRYYDSYRFSGGFNGEVGFWGLHYDVAATYGQETAFRSGQDTLVDRFELALRGLGGPLCNRAANTPGQNNCLYFNPFSTAIQSNAVTGAVNPQYNSAVANNTDLIRWFFQQQSTKQRDNLLVLDAVVSGEVGGFQLPGGPIKYGVGLQYREEHLVTEYNDLGNASVNPCVNSPDFGVVNCTGAARNGPFVFLGEGTPADLESDVKAVFGELQFPLLHNVDVQFAARYEDYGGLVGDTFNPKVSAKWQALPWLGFRFSAGSTFRGPPVAQLAPGSITSLQSIGGTFRAVDVIGNPALRPEQADTYNVGLLLKFAGFNGSLDFFDFEFDNPIVADPVAGIVNTVFPAGRPDRCNDPAVAALVSRFSFAGACSLANINRLQTFNVNGASVSNSGLDLNLNYRHPLFDGMAILGAQATYVLDYRVGPTTVAGVRVDNGFNAVGKLNYQTTVVPIPRYKGSVFAEYSIGRHDARLTFNLIDGYTDQRTDPFVATAATNNQVLGQGKRIGSFFTVDFNYRLQLPFDTTATLSVDNLADEDPPFARLDLSYDPFTANPYGRTVRFSLRKKF